MLIIDIASIKPATVRNEKTRVRHLVNLVNHRYFFSRNVMTVWTGRLMKS